MENEVNEPSISYDKLYTYADYYSWDIDKRIELIKGKVFDINPTTLKHQIVSRELAH